MHPHNSTFEILSSVDSTNNYAMAKVHAGLAKHGDAWFAMEQTGGKGQRGNKWHTGSGKNIAISIVVKPSFLFIKSQFKLSAAVALACYDFFIKYAGDETCIKWPNDIYWRDRKAGGILIENVIGNHSNREPLENKWKYAVIGIGININQARFDASLKNPVSLRQITGKEFDVVALAKELQQTVLQHISILEKHSFQKILQRYNQCLYKLNKHVRLKKKDIEFETIIKGVTENGQLYTTDLIDNYFDFGEVEWIL